MKIISNLILVALSACATLYQKEGLFFPNGYSDMRAGQDTFVVTFKASEHTSEKKVKKYLLRRAAEVTLENGYQYFKILDQTGKAKHLHYPSQRITIQCFHEKPEGSELIDAKSLVK